MGDVLKTIYIHSWWLICLIYFFLSFVVFQTSRVLWQFFSIKELIKLVLSVGCFSLTIIVIASFSNNQIPLLTLLYFVFIASSFLLVSLLAIRLLVRVLYGYKTKNLFNKSDEGCNSKKRTIIVGAGQAGNKVLREIQDYPQNQYNVVGFVDDDSSKSNCCISGVPILGTTSKLNDLITKHQIDALLLAIPSIASKERRDLVIGIKDTHVEIVTVPGIYELLNGNIDISALRKVKIEDLLPRKPIQTDLSKVKDIISGKVVLLTGAGGSIGSELARQICNFKPEKLILFEMCENNLFYIDQELKNERQKNEIVPLVADMRNKRRVEEIFEMYKPDIVFHAAAYKHVPLMELNPTEAYENNVEGSKNLLDASIKHNVKKFINISTDKAVNPSCVMGKTKQQIEVMITEYDKKNGLLGASVRFGNVLGSEGSVLKVFKRQIEEEGLIRITDLEMKRYFMLIPEAVELVLQAASLAEGGDIFFLKMGEQVRIIDLARAYTRLKGYELEKDIKLKVIGNRGNEKLAEELWSNTETPLATENDFIFRIGSQKKAE
jgi:FlaA1/EpsC-like NDP-sugar epimerase